MNIRDFLDLKLLQKIQDQFSEATGLAAIAVDAQGEYITEGSNFTDFCMKYTRGTPEGMRRCVKCDTECTGTYFCHAGLMDFASDIIVNGERVGAIIGGQVLPQAADPETFRQIAREIGVADEDGYLRALDKVPVRSERMIRSAAELLGDVVNMMVNMEYERAATAKKITVVDGEVTQAMESIKGIKSKMRDLQTVASMENILSINASIEAGRAGRQGAGFGVVAREIGELSKSSSKVYGEIREYVDVIEKAILHMSEKGL